MRTEFGTKYPCLRYSMVWCARHHGDMEGSTHIAYTELSVPVQTHRHTRRTFIVTLSSPSVVKTRLVEDGSGVGVLT